MNIKMCFTQIKKEEVRKFSERELLWQAIYCELLKKDSLKEKYYTFRVAKFLTDDTKTDDCAILTHMTDYKSASAGIAERAVITDSITFLGSYAQTELEMSMSYKEESFIDLFFNEYKRGLSDIDSKGYLFLDVSELKESIYYYVISNFYERIHTRVVDLGIHTIFIFKGDKSTENVYLKPTIQKV